MSELWPEGRNVINAFSLGADGRVPPAVARVIGLPGGRSQARILVTARNKSVAAELLRAAGIHPPSLSSGEFHTAHGNDLNALRTAGQIREGRVLCLKPHASTTAVVALDGKEMSVIGSLLPGDTPFNYRFDDFREESS